VSAKGARFSTTILGFSAACTAMSVLAFAAWAVSGDQRWIDYFLRAPIALMLVSLPVLEMGLAWHVARSFSATEPLRRAWTWIAVSAAFAGAGALCTHIFGGDGPLGLWAVSIGRPELRLVEVGRLGQILGGTFRFGFLSAGLFFALRAYRSGGLLGHFRRIDWLLLAGLAAYVCAEFWDLAVAMRQGRRPDAFEAMGWPVDPLLWFLIAESLLILRSVQRTGMGRIGRCWSALVVGVLLTSVGDIVLWATGRGYLPWPWSSVGWFVWLPAACAFALGPAYQLEAIQEALCRARYAPGADSIA